MPQLPVHKFNKARRIYHLVVSCVFMCWLLFMATADNSTLSTNDNDAKPIDSNLIAAAKKTKRETFEPTMDSESIQEDSTAIKPRVWRSWPVHAPLPCFEPDMDMFSEAVQNTQSRIGFLYVRPLKTGSSSMNGAVIRAAQQLAKRENYGFEICKLRIFHGFASTYGYIQRDKDKSFLYSSLRDPTKRAVSRFFFAQVSRRKVEPTDLKFIGFLKAMFQSSYLKSLSMMPYQDTPEHYQRDVRHVLEDYDFIAVTEQMDESLVVMQMLLGLETTDMLYFAVKTNGGYDDGGTNMGCTYIQKSILTDGMREYLESDDWKTRTRSDYMLYEAAKKSLHLTIDHLGRDKFNKNLEDFRQAMVEAKAKCDGLVKFPCAPDGSRNSDTDCIWEDSGCGQTCLNDVTIELQHHRR